ncbi:MAG: 2-phospho-L-lactate guanylyltransferase [Azonexus sp.]|nr:2-phospho-L-lactate guanylyltransferase [Azonexus sp.]
MRRLYALVPLKNLSCAKTRLANALADADRSALVMAMAHDVTVALAQSRLIERVVLVSDIADLPDLIGVPGVTRYIPASACGLNEDLSEAAVWAGDQGATDVLIAHADLPLLTPALIDRFAQATRPGELRIAPCKHDSGTNLLLAPLPLPLVYGAGSLARFQSLAAAAGLSCDLWRNPMLAMDIDELADYEALQFLCQHGSFRNSATAALLRRQMGQMGRSLRTEIQPQLRYGSSFHKKIALFST